MALGTKYKNSFNNPMGGGKTEGTFTFDIKGDTFTGMATATGLESVPIQDGKINGDEIQFVMISKSQMGEMKSTIKATINGDNMTGTIDLGMGPPTPFEATKVE